MSEVRHSELTRQRVFELLQSEGIRGSEVLAAVEAGSTAHDISVGGDDLDFTVIRIETFSELLRGPQKRQSLMIRTKPQGARSEPGDIDLQVYTLRRFVDLAAAGNPSVLMILFAPEAYDLLPGDFPTNTIARLTRSKRAASAYQGYMNRQIERWTGERGQKSVTRSETVDVHGYDTKYAAHTIRLGIQGAEFLATGHLTLPMRPADAARVKAVRRGETTEEQALEWAHRLLEDLEDIAAVSQLPERVDAEAIDTFLLDFYSRRYGLT